MDDNAPRRRGASTLSNDGEGGRAAAVEGDERARTEGRDIQARPCEVRRKGDEIGNAERRRGRKLLEVDALAAQPVVAELLLGRGILAQVGDGMRMAGLLR